MNDESRMLEYTREARLILATIQDPIVTVTLPSHNSKRSIGCQLHNRTRGGVTTVLLFMRAGYCATVHARFLLWASDGVV